MIHAIQTPRITRSDACSSTAIMSESVDSVDTVDSIPQGHVRLVLFSKNDSSFYLQIPLDIIDSLCLKPRKYLVFLGWCILGVQGHLALEHGGDGIPLNGSLEDQRMYYYVADVGGKFYFQVVAVLHTRY